MAQTSDELRIDLGSSEELQPEEIREQMAETRAALTEKLETLHERVEGTVEAAHATVDAVTEKVQDTIQSVKRTFDVKYQVDRHPWTLVGASVLTGFTLGCLSRNMPLRVPARSEGSNGFAAPASRPAAPSSLGARAQPIPKEPVLSRFDEEIGKLKSVAVGAAMALVRDWLKDAVPSVSHQLDDVMDSATQKLGGEPIQGPVFGHASHA
jgi:ElaB/YqjD/DUF883 family membrane-anchored ribosome-binding protein